MTTEILKEWDGNERITEGRNGRVYTSAGRWTWTVVVDGQMESTHDTRRAAVARVNHLVDAWRKAAGLAVDAAPVGRYKPVGL